MSQVKRKSHKLLPGVNSAGSFLPGREPEQLFVFTYPERPESPGPVKLYRVYLFKIPVDLVVDSCYIGVSKKENAMKTVTYDLPDFWASALFNDDTSGWEY